MALINEADEVFLGDEAVEVFLGDVKVWPPIMRAAEPDDPQAIGE